MSDIKTLKSKLVDHLVDQLEHPPEGGVPNGVLTTASAMVKNFAHEIDDGEGELSIKDDKLRKFLSQSGKSAH
jgi:hypothetical protein